MSQAPPMAKRTGKSVKMGSPPNILGRMWRRYCEKRMNRRMVGRPISTQDPTPEVALPQPAPARERPTSAIVGAMVMGDVLQQDRHCPGVADEDLDDSSADDRA